METPSILSEVSSDDENKYVCDILLTEKSVQPEKLLVKMKENVLEEIKPSNYKSTYEKYLNETDRRNILHVKHRKRW
jgi:hypothetical protein